jgi:hypothetical protein
MFDYFEMMLLLRWLGASRHDRRAAQTPDIVVMCSSEQAASGALNDFLGRLSWGHGSKFGTQGKDIQALMREMLREFN